MQTFLPYESFEETASVLDKRRLNKQRIEAWQIYLAITNPKYGWQNHPAVNMWRGHQSWLLQYGIVMCSQWQKIGGKDNVELYVRFWKALARCRFTLLTKDKPEWLGNEAFHRSHQSNLVRKDPAFYRQFFPEVPDNIPYFWPVSKLDAIKKGIDEIKKGMGYEALSYVNAENLSE